MLVVFSIVTVQTDKHMRIPPMKFSAAMPVAGLALLVSTFGASAATVIISDFQTYQHVETRPGAGQVSSSEVYSVSAAKIGGYRDMRVTNNSTTRTSATTLTSQDGLLDFSNAARIIGTGTLTWNGLGSVGLGGVDITDSATNNALFLDVIFADANLTLSFSVTDTSNRTSTLTQIVAETLTDPTSLAFLFSDFVGSADFSSLNSITFTLSGTTAGLDATIDTIYSGSTLPAVPLPAAGWLMLGAFGAMGAVARRRRG